MMQVPVPGSDLQFYFHKRPLSVIAYMLLKVYIMGMSALSYILEWLVLINVAI